MSLTHAERRSALQRLKTEFYGLPEVKAVQQKLAAENARLRADRTGARHGREMALALTGNVYLTANGMVHGKHGSNWFMYNLPMPSRKNTEAKRLSSRSHAFYYCADKSLNDAIQAVRNPRLYMVQIDGLGRSRLNSAIRVGTCVGTAPLWLPVAGLLGVRAGLRAFLGIR